MASILVPTSSALPSSQRLPSTNPSVFKILNRLTRTSLLSLILDWLDDRNQSLSAPNLADDDEGADGSDYYPPAQSLEELREYYTELQTQKGSKRDLVDRIIEGDWRHGVSLYQLAMADSQYLYDHPTSQRWTALKVVLVQTDSTTSPPIPQLTIPRFHPSTFLANLQAEIPPDIKAHYNLDRPSHLPLMLLRIYIFTSPYNTSIALSVPSNESEARTVYVAFPDDSPHIFVSLQASNPIIGTTTASDTRNLRKILQDAIPRSFSRARERYALQSTNLSARSLESLVARRGSGRETAAAGGWGVYADVKKKDTPLDLQLPTPPISGDERALSREKENSDPGLKDLSNPQGMKRKADDGGEDAAKRRKVLAEARFGNSARPNDGQGIERLDIRIEDPFPALPAAAADTQFSDDEDSFSATASQLSRRRRGRQSALAQELQLSRDGIREGEDGDGDRGWIPDVRITFHGSHVFAGLRQLVEIGVVDGERMPGWMTGEEGVSVGVVRDGRIGGFKGSGM